MRTYEHREKEREEKKKHMNEQTMRITIAQNKEPTTTEQRKKKEASKKIIWLDFMIDKNAEINSFKFLHICCGSCILNQPRITTEDTERDSQKWRKKKQTKRLQTKTT